MLKEFRLKADITFNAESIDDAFDKLVEHLQRIKEGEDSNFVELGEIEIKPVEGG